MRAGLLVEFDTTERLFDGLARLKAMGLTERLETFTPWPVEGLTKTLELPKTKVARNTLVGGVCGAMGAYLIQWWTNAYDYILDVGGRPAHAAPAFILIVFETAVLVAGITAFLSVFAYSHLPEVWDPVFEVEAFRRASIDRFWIGIERGEDALDVDRIHREMSQAGALQVVAVGGDR